MLYVGVGGGGEEHECEVVGWMSVFFVGYIDHTVHFCLYSICMVVAPTPPPSPPPSSPNTCYTPPLQLHNKMESRSIVHGFKDRRSRKMLLCLSLQS